MPLLHLTRQAGRSGGKNCHYGREYRERRERRFCTLSAVALVMLYSGNGMF